MLTRRRFTQGVAAAGVWSAASAQAQAPDFPRRAIRLLIGFPPGGSTDGPTRVLAEQVGALLGQPVVVENRPGAGGVMPVQVLQTAAADGHTLAIAPASIFRAPFTTDVPWDPLKDLSYVIGITGYTFGIVVPASSPLQTFQDYLAYARANPGAITYSTSGVATTNHITMEQMARQYKLQLHHIPYKGGAESVQAVLAGQVMSAAEASNWVPHVEAGKLRLLVVWGDKRMARYPQVPTLRESGIDIVQNSPWGVVGPKGLPAPVVARIHDAFRQAMDSPAFARALASYDMELDYRSPQDYRSFAERSVARERDLVQALGLMHMARKGG